VKAVVCYPQLKNAAVPETITQARRLGAEIVPMRGNHLAICITQAKKLITSMGGAMIPFGVESIEAVEAIAAEARTVPNEMIKGGTVVLSCGSGVTISGLLLGIDGLPKQIVGVSAGRSLQKLEQCIAKYAGGRPNNLKLVPAETPYYHTEKLDCPFPCHPNYDLKAWKYLKENSPKLPSPLFFWNIGAPPLVTGMNRPGVLLDRSPS
jgi:1-aminocyclopropane-1-carboxylate deaminase/D-cysteine desulfhydrase-like pyridoxal-dependent ACC family enzyme